MIYQDIQLVQYISWTEDNVWFWFLEMDDYVRYFYLVHKQTDGKPQTTEMRLMYKKEGGKQSSYKKIWLSQQC